MSETSREACEVERIDTPLAAGFFIDFDTAPVVEGQLRTTYDGPLALAVDYMVFNITKEDITVRMAVVNEDTWPLPSVYPKLPADPSEKIAFTDFINSGRAVFTEVIDRIYADVNIEFDSDVKPPCQ